MVSLHSYSSHKVNIAKGALLVTLNERGCVDLAFIQGHPFPASRRLRRGLRRRLDVRQHVLDGVG